MNAAALMLVALVALAACSAPSESYIRAELDRADYCETADDCVNLGQQCPIGCFLYVNEAEEERMQSLLDRFESDCVYECIECAGVKCENNRCVAECT